MTLPELSAYSIKVKDGPAGAVMVNEDKRSIDQDRAIFLQDSILKSYAMSGKKHYNPKQPGQLYQVSFNNLPGQKLYDVQFLTKKNNLVKDWVASFNYSGDVIALYRNNTLVYDQFNFDDFFSVKLKYITKQNNDPVKVQVLPMDKDYDIYVEDKVKAERFNGWDKAELKSITLTPVYNFEVFIQ